MRLPGHNVTSILGFSKAQLHPMVERIAGEPVVSFEASIQHEPDGPYGIMGDKLIPTFEYVTASGAGGKCAVFIKKQREPLPGHSEAHHYRHLAQHEAPIAGMYGALTDACGREALFLEDVRPVTDPEPCFDFLADPDRFPLLLATIAHFNAITPSADYTSEIRRDMANRAGPLGWDWGKRMSHACRALGRIRGLAQEGRLGDGLRRLCTATAMAVLAATACSLTAPLQQMVTGLTHGDFYPHSTGWRRGSGELVILDLDSVGFEPRFYDVAPWLGAPSAVQPRCGTREDLARHYLEERHRWSGQSIPLAAFLDETRMLWLAWVFMNLRWWCDRAMSGPLDPTQDDNQEYRVCNMGELHRQLDSVLGAVT